MNTAEKRISKHKVETLTTLLKAQHYYITRSYSEGNLIIKMTRHKESNFIEFKVEANPNSEFYLYHRSKLVNRDIVNTINKHLGLTLTYDYTERPSTEIMRNQLHTIVKHMMSLKYNLFWRYAGSNIHLIIENPDQPLQELVFVKNGDFLNFISASIYDNRLKEIIEKYSKVRIILIETNLNGSEEMYAIRKTKKQLELEINYALSDLFEHMQVDNKDKINETKEVLEGLRRQLMNYR